MTLYPVRPLGTGCCCYFTERILSMLSFWNHWLNYGGVSLTAANPSG